MWKWRRCAPHRACSWHQTHQRKATDMCQGRTVTQRNLSGWRKGPTGTSRNLTRTNVRSCHWGEVAPCSSTGHCWALQAKLHSQICPIHRRVPSSPHPAAQELSLGTVSPSCHFPCALCPAHGQAEQALSAPASPRRARLCFLLFLSAPTRCIIYKSTRKCSALHSSLFHNYYFIAFLQTKLYWRMWLESVLE